MTDDEAKAMLKQLTAHYGEPVMPIKRYCEALEAWSKCHQERAVHLRNELFPDMRPPYDCAIATTSPGTTEVHEAIFLGASFIRTSQAFKDASELYHKERVVTDRLSSIYRRGEKPTQRDYDLEELVRYERAAESINYVFLQIRKSCLLDRLLYGGQQLRTQMCPEHKGHWVGLEHDTNYCKHGCQFTGWLPEPVDKPPYPPGVFQWVTSNADGTATRELRKDGQPWFPPEVASPPPPDPGPEHHPFIAMDPNPLERK